MLKKTLSLFLSVLLIFSLASAALAAESSDSFGAYKHVFIIGVDGVGAAWGRDDVASPNFDRIFKGNAYRYNGIAEFETTSAQNWGSILCGVAYDVHGFKNGWIEENERSSDSANNSIFCYTRQAYPDAELVSFNNWDAINHGIIENDLDVKKIHRSTDPLVTQEVVSYLNAGNEPTLLFVQLDSVDHAAHASGGFSKEYYKAAEKADTFIGDIYDAVEKNGLMADDGLFIVVADHGETAGGHGGQTVEESSVVVAVAGKTVNDVELNENIRNRDVAAIALYALGIEQPDHMTAVLPAELFGEEKDKTTEKAETSFLSFLRKIGNFFVKLVNMLVGIFDGSLFIG